MDIHAAQMLLQAQDMDWEVFPDKEASLGEIRWKIFAGSPDSESKGITFGVCEIPPGAGMKPHHHKQPEYYYILEGKGTVTLGCEKASVTVGSVVYIPTDMVHGITNTNKEKLTLIWMFPTNSWNDVKYSLI